MYMQTKNYFRKKDYKMMYKGSNCDQKSRLSEILTEPLNPRGGCYYFLVTFCATSLNIKDIVDLFSNFKCNLLWLKCVVSDQY